MIITDNSNDTDRKFLAYIIIRAPAVNMRRKKSSNERMKSKIYRFSLKNKKKLAVIPDARRENDTKSMTADDDDDDATVIMII